MRGLETDCGRVSQDVFVPPPNLSATPCHSLSLEKAISECVNRSQGHSSTSEKYWNVYLEELGTWKFTEVEGWSMMKTLPAGKSHLLQIVAMATPS